MTEANVNGDYSYSGETELSWLKEAIEDGDSCIEAYEQADLNKMELEGNIDVADKIRTVLRLTKEINDAAGVE